MQGLTKKGLADDLGMMYGDWGDVISYNGSVIEGFVSDVETYDLSGETQDIERIKELHTRYKLTKNDTVTVNNVDYKIESRLESEGAYVYRLNK